MSILRVFVCFLFLGFVKVIHWVHHICFKANSGEKDYIIGAVTHTMVKRILHVDEAVVNFNGE